MINRATGIITGIVSAEEHLLELQVAVGDKTARAYAFPQMTGSVRCGDKVLLNTTAVDLALGSGGYHFVMAVLQGADWGKTGSQEKNSGTPPEKGKGPGHIMKMRYTPYQFRVLAVEEENSPWHAQMKKAESLAGTPVVAGSLHSMLAPCVCGIKGYAPQLKAVYVMTDGGALPLAFSRAVKALRKEGLLSGVVTAGHAFGGDYEAVNLYSGLLAAKEVFQAKVIVVMMGPGIVGTGTAWGHTGLELGQIINSVFSLGGECLVIPRLSFAERRERHNGVSHHTLKALRNVALAPSTVVLPEMPEEQKKRILRALGPEDSDRHQLIWERGEAGIATAQERGLSLSYMGRGYQEDPYFFLAAAAAGQAAAKKVH
ncbi:MAG: DUF3866 family protein [Clostridia bacterium]|nr:DUF3866 family protein [Clostridia bacterium]